MKKFLVVLLLAAIGNVQAQDFNWAGWYAGAELGHNEFRGNWVTTQSYDPNGGSIGFASDSSNNFKSNGTVGSLTAGYNWLVQSRWVVGGEAKLTYADQKKTIDYIPGLDPTPDLNPGDGMFSTATVKAKSGGVLRARGGYLVSPATLIYGTAGVAYQEVQVEGTCPADTNVCNPALGSRGTSKSKGLWGWTLGAGVEYAFAQHWTARLDYAFTSYQKMDFVALQWEPGASFGADASIKPRSQTVTAGVSFRF